MSDHPGLSTFHAGLNRTSVGLKLAQEGEERPQSWIAPQSNQRGIETIVKIEDPEEIFLGLNRTSVGLKRS